MPPLRDLDRIEHMLEAAREAVDAVRDRSRSDLDRDRVLRRALERLIEIIGEAAKQVSQPTRDLAPKIPWRRIAGARDRIIHGYDTVDAAVLWDIASSDLVVLMGDLESLRARIEDLRQGDPS